MNCSVGNDVALAARLLAAGKLVAFPTETVYGLGAAALNSLAVAAVFAAKGRPLFDPLIVHVAETAAARQLTTTFPDMAERLAERFWPGPLTLVLPKANQVPDLVTAGLPSVALRVPQHPLALRLITQAGVPVAAPSANLFGHVSPTTAPHVVEQLGDRIDYVLDGGPCTVGIESTVLHLAGDRPTLLRPGGVPVEEIERLIGPVTIPDQHGQTTDAPQGDAPQLSPGLLERHYAPRTPLQLVNELPPHTQRAGCGLLSFGPGSDVGGFAAVEVLSQECHLAEAAANLYAAIRRLDQAGLTRIIAEPFPQTGLGRALNDRLSRAACDST